jgi:hypothetical protein
MDMANYLASHLGSTDICHYERTDPALKDNAQGLEHKEMSQEKFFSAICKNKKYIDMHLKLVLPDSDIQITVGMSSNDEKCKHLRIQYLKEGCFQ